MIKRSIAIGRVTVFVLALATIAVAADDPFVGTWVWNTSSSKENTPAFKGTYLSSAQPNWI